MVIRRNRPTLQLLDDGFVMYRPGHRHVRFRWQDVVKIVARKADLVCMAFQTREQVWEIDEGMEGFDDVVRGLAEALPEADEKWRSRVGLTASEPNAVTVFERQPSG